MIILEPLPYSNENTIPFFFCHLRKLNIFTDILLWEQNLPRNNLFSCHYSVFMYI
jgi:hypothetical protein